MHWKVLAGTTALCDVRLRLWRKAAMHTWLCPCDTCAKGELVHAEATSTSDLVFGISIFAAIELYQSYGCAYASASTHIASGFYISRGTSFSGIKLGAGINQNW